MESKEEQRERSAQIHTGQSKQTAVAEEFENSPTEQSKQIAEASAAAYFAVGQAEQEEEETAWPRWSSCSSEPKRVAKPGEQGTQREPASGIEPEGQPIHETVERESDIVPTGQPIHETVERESEYVPCGQGSHRSFDTLQRNTKKRRDEKKKWQEQEKRGERDLGCVPAGHVSK
jgi:hypothetical protein